MSFNENHATWKEQLGRVVEVKKEMPGDLPTIDRPTQAEVELVLIGSKACRIRMNVRCFGCSG